MSQLTSLFTQFITNAYIQTGLLGILIAMAIESCCIPLPSEIVMPVAGLLLRQGKILPGINPILGIVLLALAGAVGCLLGSIAAYWIGYKGGRPLMLKYGRYVLISQHDADKADAFFAKYGSATAFFSRLLPVVRTYISLPAGMTKMPFAKFCLYTLAGSFPWCLLLAYVGTVIGDHMETLKPIFNALDGVILVAIVVLVVLYVWRHVRNDNRARAEHAASGADGVQNPAQQPQQQWVQNPAQQPQQQWVQNPAQQPQQQQWGQNPAQPPQPQSPRW